MQARILDVLPDRLLDQPATELHRLLDGPTLIHLPGRNPRPLVVSVLQHGNETSGWDAIRRLLKGRYARDPLPRSLLLLIGNVRAAARGMRHLADQPDFNRCWPGSRGPETIWHRLFAELTRYIQRCEPFACIDIHNNTGQNPHYAAVNQIEAQRLHLASLFSKTVVYFTEPAGVQSMAFGRFAPAVTLECGLAAEQDGTDHAMTYLDRALNLDRLPDRAPEPDQLELFEMFATVKVAEGVDFDFQGQASELRFPMDLDRYNFREIARGTPLASYDPAMARVPLLAHGHDGRDLSSECFIVDDGQIKTRRPLMPAMLTTDEHIVRQDCLCYFMERLCVEDKISPDQGLLEPAALPESEP